MYFQFRQFVRYFSWLAFLASLVLYILCCARTLVGHDSGELASAQYFFGIAHPTGYPLFCLIGWLWTKIPLGIAPIFQLNLLSAILGAISVKLAYHLIFQLISTHQNDFRAGLTALFGSLTFAVSSTFWFISVHSEVYALSVCLQLSMLLATVYACEKQMTFKRWLIVAVLAGLCLSNHLSALAVFPTVIFFFWWNRTQFRTKMIVAAQLTFTCLLVASGFYFLMLLRAQTSVLPNWGEPANWGALWFHLSARDYQIFFEQNQNGFVSNAFRLIQLVYAEMSAAFWVLAICGCITAVLLKSRKVIFFLPICLFTLLLWSNYAIIDLRFYLTASLIANIIFLCFVLYQVTQKLKFDKVFYCVIITLLISVVFQAQSRFDQQDQSKNFALQQYATRMLSSFEDRSILLTTDFDLFSSPAMYLQLVEGIRQDVLVIDLRLLTSRPWYVRQLTQRISDVGYETLNQTKALETYLRTLNVNENAYRGSDRLLLQEWINALLQENLSLRPIYIDYSAYRDLFTVDAAYALDQHITVTPQAYAYQFHDQDIYRPLKKGLDEQFDFPPDAGRYTEAMRITDSVPTEIKGDFHLQEMNIYYRRALMIDHRMQYELRFGKTEEAKNLLTLLNQHYPAYGEPHALKSTMIE